MDYRHLACAPAALLIASASPRCSQLTQTGDLRKAEQCYTKALTIEPDRRTLGEAITLYQKTIDLHGATPDRVYNLALAHFRSGDPEASLKILKAYPGSTGEWYALAAANRRALGDTRAAAEDLRNAIRHSPDNESYRYDYILALLRSGGEADAGKELDAAVAQFPRSAKLHSMLGMRAYGSGRNEEALRHYETAVSLEPKAADLRAALGDIYNAMADYQKAAVSYAEATRLDPGDPDYHVKEGNTLMRLQNPAAAGRAFRKGLTADPGNVAAHLQLGKIAFSDARYTAALTHFEKAAAGKEAPAEVFYQLSQTYHRMGRQGEAGSALKIFQERKSMEKDRSIQ